MKVRKKGVISGPYLSSNIRGRIFCAVDNKSNIFQELKIETGISHKCSGANPNFRKRAMGKIKVGFKMFLKRKILISLNIKIIDLTV